MADTFELRHSMAINKRIDQIEAGFKAQTHQFQLLQNQQFDLDNKIKKIVYDLQYGNESLKKRAIEFTKEIEEDMNKNDCLNSHFDKIAIQIKNNSEIQDLQKVCLQDKLNQIQPQIDNINIMFLEDFAFLKKLKEMDLASQYGQFDILQMQQEELEDQIEKMNLSIMSMKAQLNDKIAFQNLQDFQDSIKGEYATELDLKNLKNIVKMNNRFAENNYATQQQLLDLKNFLESNEEKMWNNCKTSIDITIFDKISLLKNVFIQQQDLIEVQEKIFKQIGEDKRDLMVQINNKIINLIEKLKPDELANRLNLLKQSFEEKFLEIQKQHKSSIQQLQVSMSQSFVQKEQFNESQYETSLNFSQIFSNLEKFHLNISSAASYNDVNNLNGKFDLLNNTVSLQKTILDRLKIEMTDQKLAIQNKTELIQQQVEKHLKSFLKSNDERIEKRKKQRTPLQNKIKLEKVLNESTIQEKYEQGEQNEENELNLWSCLNKVIQVIKDMIEMIQIPQNSKQEYVNALQAEESIISSYVRTHHTRANSIDQVHHHHHDQFRISKLSNTQTIRMDSDVIQIEQNQKRRRKLKTSFENT